MNSLSCVNAYHFMQSADFASVLVCSIATYFAGAWYAATKFPRIDKITLSGGVPECDNIS